MLLSFYEFISYEMGILFFPRVIIVKTSHKIQQLIKNFLV